MGARSASGMNVTADSAMRVTAVMRCVALRSQTLASLPLTVERNLTDGGHEVARNHPLFPLLAYQPNKWQTSFEWREMMEAHFCLRGACYSEIVSTGGAAVSELVPLHPDRVRPFRATSGKLAFEYTPAEGSVRIILQDEMFYLHLMTSDGVTPISPIKMHREAIGLSMATEEHGARLFGNGARPGGILKMAGRLKDDESRKRLRESWREVHGGVENSHRVAVLEDGLEWQTIGMTSEDAQFLETRNLQISEICRIFGVPPHKVGELTRSTNNNIEHQGIEWVTDTIQPQAIRWEQAMQRDLFAGRRTHSAMFDLDGLMRGDSTARAAFNASAVQNGYMTRNEVRRNEGRNVSTAAGMEDFTVQMNLVPVGRLGEALDAANAPAKTDDVTRALLASIEQRCALPAPGVTIHNAAPVAPNVEVHNDVHVPAQAAPVVHVTTPASTVEVRNDVHVPAQAAPTVQVNVPEQRAADVVVNVPSDMTMRVTEMPPRKTTSAVERNAAGEIVQTTQIEKDI
jgi:HK97 family phage portal protein